MITSNLTNMSLGRSNSQQNQHLSWNQTDQLAKSAVQTLMILTYSRTLIIQYVTAAGKVLDLRCRDWWLELFCDIQFMTPCSLVGRNQYFRGTNYLHQGRSEQNLELGGLQRSAEKWVTQECWPFRAGMCTALANVHMVTSQLLTFFLLIWWQC